MTPTERPDAVNVGEEALAAILTAKAKPTVGNVMRAGTLAMRALPVVMEQAKFRVTCPRCALGQHRPRRLRYTDGVTFILLTVPWASASGQIPPPFIDFHDSLAGATRRFLYDGPAS